MDFKKFFDFGKLGNLFKKKASVSDGDHTIAMPDFDDDLPNLDTQTAATGDADSITLESDAPVEKIKIKLKKPGEPGRTKKLATLLLLLVLVGGGYYAVSNDMVDTGPIADAAKPVVDLARPYLEMAGLMDPPPPPAPAPKPRRPVKKAATAKTPAARTAAKPAAAAPAKTSTAAAAKPLAGTISGQAFAPDTVEYMRGYLVLREGPASAPKHEIRLVIPHNDWELPAGKEFESGMFSSAEMTLIDNGSEPRVLSTGIDMEVNFAKADNATIAGAIKLESKDHHLMVEGDFKASVSGFRTLNGEPVLTGDANETLMVVALKHLISKEPNKDISNVAYRDAQLSPANRPRSGSLVMEYAINNKEFSRNFQFKKTSKGWQVSKMSAEK